MKNRHFDKTKEVEDESDLLYERVKAEIVNDHKTITNCLMLFSVLIMLCQVAFGGWCISSLNSSTTYQECMLILWLHIIKIA